MKHVIRASIAWGACVCPPHFFKARHYRLHDFICQWRLIVQLIGELPGLPVQINVMFGSNIKTTWSTDLPLFKTPVPVRFSPLKSSCKSVQDFYVLFLASLSKARIMTTSLLPLSSLTSAALVGFIIPPTNGFALPQLATLFYLIISITVRKNSYQLAPSLYPHKLSRVFFSIAVFPSHVCSFLVA